MEHYSEGPKYERTRIVLEKTDANRTTHAWIGPV